MKKIIIGLIQTALSPFIVILGYYLIGSFKLSDGAMIFASIMGGTSVVFNFIMGCALIIKGYQDVDAFKGWKI